MDPEMTSDQKFEKTKLFELTQIDRGPDSACKISSQSKEMKHGVLATPARKLSPAMIPNVGVRVARRQANTQEQELLSTQQEDDRLSLSVRVQNM